MIVSLLLFLGGALSPARGCRDPSHPWRGRVSLEGVMTEPLCFHCSSYRYCWNISSHSHLTTPCQPQRACARLKAQGPQGPGLGPDPCPCPCEGTHHSAGISLQVSSPASGPTLAATLQSPLGVTRWGSRRPCAQRPQRLAGRPPHGDAPPCPRLLGLDFLC